MPVLTQLQFFLIHGLNNLNELDAPGVGVSPLALKHHTERRNLTALERQDYDRMTWRGPKVYGGPIPRQGDPGVFQVTTAVLQRITYTIVRLTNGRLHCFALGFKFYSIPQCQHFIQDYNICSTGNNIRALVTGNRNKVARRRKAHMLCATHALEMYYNGRAVHGTTVRSLRRRGLINKLVV